MTRQELNVFRLFNLTHLCSFQWFGPQKRKHREFPGGAAELLQHFRSGSLHRRTAPAAELLFHVGRLASDSGVTPSPGGVWRVVLMWRLLISSLCRCGVSWYEDHVSLDCRECGGYSLERPCPTCEGSCSAVWKRDLTMVREMCYPTLICW